MRPYSQDLRERVIHAVETRDGSQAEIAERFAVSHSFVEKLWQRWRQTGSYAAWPHAGGRQRSLRAAEQIIRRAVTREPDVTLASLCEQVARRQGIQVSTKTMCVEVQRLHLPRKKSRSMQASATPSG